MADFIGKPGSSVIGLPEIKIITDSEAIELDNKLRKIDENPVRGPDFVSKYSNIDLTYIVFKDDFAYFETTPKLKAFNYYKRIFDILEWRYLNGYGNEDITNAIFWTINQIGMFFDPDVIYKDIKWNYKYEKLIIYELRFFAKRLHEGYLSMNRMRALAWCILVLKNHYRKQIFPQKETV